MIKIVKMSLVVLMASSVLAVAANEMKLYDVKSGKVSYEIKGSGNIMGSQTKSMGIKQLIFDRYGADNFTEEYKTEKRSMMGQTQTQKSHNMTYLKEGVMYSVDFERKKIVRMENTMAMMGGNMAAKGKAMMKQMGGKKIGMDNVLDYSCEVWELMGTQQCIYKGVPLRVESNMMGIKHTEVATSAKFDISISKDDFKLPDFPLSNEMGTSINKNKLEKMDNKAQEEAKKTQAQIAAMMGAMANASQEVGLEPGQRPNVQQEEQMHNAMMGAMLPMMKKEILAEEQNVRFAKECLGDADTQKEANDCNRKLNEMSGEDEEPFSSWNTEDKQQIMQEMDQYLNVILPCVKRAQSAQEIQSCMQ